MEIAFPFWSHAFVGKRKSVEWKRSAPFWSHAFVGKRKSVEWKNEWARREFRTADPFFWDLLPFGRADSNPRLPDVFLSSAREGVSILLCPDKSFTRPGKTRVSLETGALIPILGGFQAELRAQRLGRDLNPGPGSDSPR